MDNIKQFLLKHIAQRYKATFVKEYTTGNSQNIVFEIEKDSASFILRASEYSDKKKEHVDIELNWVNYLAQSLDNIVKPIRIDNNLYEIVSAKNKSYILCMFEKARGKPVDINNPLEFNDKLFFNMGALMGSMHRLTTKYEGNAKAGTILHANELRELPKTKDCYGIIHDDMHVRNFFIDKGQINLFDFDDCKFSWYVEDIASAFFYMLFFAQIWKNPEGYLIGFAENYLQAFFKGYKQAHIINKHCLSKFNVFLRYRMEGVYWYLSNMYKCKPENPHEDFLFWLNHKLINNLPLVDIDFDIVV